MQYDAGKEQGRPAAGVALAQPAWLTHLAHDLRGPLSPLSSALALLRSGRLDSLQQAETCGLAQQQLEILSQLLDDTADLLALPARRGVQVDLASLADMARVRVSRRLHNAGCALTLAAAAPLPPVEAEPRSLLRLITGLLLRCAEIAGPGSRLNLRLAAADAPLLQISVESSEPARTRERCAALAATLCGCAQIHVADAALASVLSAYALRLQLPPATAEPGLLLCWPEPGT